MIILTTIFLLFPGKIQPIFSLRLRGMLRQQLSKFEKHSFLGFQMQRNRIWSRQPCGLRRKLYGVSRKITTSGLDGNYYASDVHVWRRSTHTWEEICDGKQKESYLTRAAVIFLVTPIQRTRLTESFSHDSMAVPYAPLQTWLPSLCCGFSPVGLRMSGTYKCDKAISAKTVC